MAGKPWTSNACGYCRKRKVKCDEVKPECGRCVKRGTKCPGYQEYRNWINCSSTRVMVNSHNPLPAVHATSRQPCSSILPEFYSKQPVRVQMFSSFIQYHFYSGNTASKVNLQEFLFSGLSLLPRKGELMEKALAAMSCLFWGKIRSDSRVLFHGIRLYNDAIRIMARLICQNNYTDEILYCAFIFQEIAAFYSPSGLKSWGVHVSGMNAVIRYFRSRANSNPLINAIYDHQQKFNTVLLSRGMDLSPVEYEHIMQPTGGNPLLEILQIAVTIGKLQGVISSIDPSDHMAGKEFLNQCHEVKYRLMNLQSIGSLGETPSVCSSSRFLEPEKMKIPPTEPLFGLAYHFSSQDHVMLYMMFWVHLVLLQPLICRARAIVDVHNTNKESPNNPTADHEYLLSAAYAAEIARALPYSLQKNMGSSCIQVILFVTSTISTIFVEFEDRDGFDWCQHVLQHLADSGFNAAQQLVILANSRWETHASHSRQKKFICVSLRRQIHY